jgi:hypothetical protein
MRACHVPGVLIILILLTSNLLADAQQIVSIVIGFLSNSFIGNLFVTSVAAFVAYYFWSAYNRPYLTVEGHDRMDLIMPQQHKENRKKHRISIRNLGRVPATDCKAFFQLQGEDAGGHQWDEIIYVNMPLAWYNKRGHLFTNQSSDYSETRTLASGEREYVDLFEQPNGQGKPYDWVDPSERPILHVWENNRGNYDLDQIKESVIFRDSSNEPASDELSYKQLRDLSYTNLRQYDWIDAKIILITDEGGQTTHHCDFEWSSDNELSITIKDRSGLDSLKHRFRRLDYWIWN